MDNQYSNQFLRLYQFPETIYVLPVDNKSPFYTIVFNILFHSVQNHRSLMIPCITDIWTPQTFSGRNSESGNSARNPRPTIINDDN